MADGSRPALKLPAEQPGRSRRVRALGEWLGDRTVFLLLRAREGRPAGQPGITCKGLQRLLRAARKWSPGQQLQAPRCPLVPKSALYGSATRAPRGREARAPLTPARPHRRSLCPSYSRPYGASGFAPVLDTRFAKRAEALGTGTGNEAARGFAQSGSLLSRPHALCVRLHPASTQQGVLRHRSFSGMLF